MLRSPAPLSTLRRGWTATLISIGGALTALDLKIVNVALPQIGAEFGAGLASLEWTVNAYTLAFASLLLTAGATADRLGGWPIFSAGIVTFTVASAACGMAPGTGSLIAFRAVQGIGASLILATSFALLARAYSGPGRVTAITAYVTVSTAAANLGPLVGGALVDTLGWRGIFLINLPIGILLLLALLGVRSEPAVPAPTGRQLDLTGAVLAALGLFSLNYALLTGATEGWQRLDVLVTVAVAVLAIGGFLAVQRHKGDAAMFDLRLFAISSFRGAIALSFLARVVSFGMLPFFVFWLQGMLGYSALGTGLRLLTMSLPVLLAASLSGWLQRHLTARTLIAAGSAAAAVGALLLLRIGPETPWTVAVPGFVLIGLGSGIVFPPLIGIAVGVVAPQRAGMASGMTNTFFPVGIAVGVAGFGVVLTAAVDAGNLAGPVRDAVVAGQFERVPPAVVAAANQAFTDGLHLIAIGMAVLSAVSALIALITIRDADRHQAPEPVTTPPR